MRKQWIYIFLITIIYSSCKKTVPVAIPATPEFYYNGLIDTSTLIIEAGKNNYYMQTGVSKDALGYNYFYGKLDPQNTTSNYLQMKLFNYYNGNNPLLDSLYIPGKTYYSYTLDTLAFTSINGKRFSFIYSSNVQDVASIKWYFGDGDSSVGTSLNVDHVYTTSGIVTVSCFVQYNNGNTDFLTNNVDVTYGNTCNNLFTVTSYPTVDSVVLTAINTANKYIWTLPNGTVDSTTGNKLYYQEPITTRDYFYLKTITGSCTTNYKQVAAPRNATAQCNFIYYNSDTVIKNYALAKNNYKAVIMEYYKDGKIYSTFINDSTIAQNTKPIFTLKSAAPYIKNNSGLRTTAIIGDVDCILYNTTNSKDSIVLKSKAFKFALGML